MIESIPSSFVMRQETEIDAQRFFARLESAESFSDNR